MTKMADGVDIDLYADDLEQDFAQVMNTIMLVCRTDVIGVGLAYA